MSQNDGHPDPLASRVGKYDVIARLGKGGMAHVHLALSRGVGGFNKLVVLKRLDSSDESFRQMFLDEAKLAALLHHPNVVQTYEVSEADGLYFIAMEYLEGQPLDKIIRESKKRQPYLEPRLCARIVAEALSGLHYIHELRDYEGRPLEIVHRDVSPHNLFLTYEGTVKLLDFGVAQTAVKLDQTAVGVLKGKLAYMAPEQAAAEAIDRRADLYASGVVLWELLTLERLRRGSSAADVLNEAINGSIAPLDKLRADVPRELEAILWQALARAPERRYQTAQQMRDALNEYLQRDPCSSEELADFMHRSFAEQREQMQRQITACLRSGDLHPGGVAELAPSSRRATDFSAVDRSLPLLDSGSLPARRDDATTPLAPSPLHDPLPSLEPKLDPNLSSRSRALTFTEEAPAEGGIFRFVVLGCLAAALALGLLWTKAANRSQAASGETHAPEPRRDPAGAAVLLRLHGSNTIGQELAPLLAEAFLKDQGYVAVERGAPGEHTSVNAKDPRDGKALSIEIVAQGSSTAFTDLADGRCDVGLSSRRIRPEEAKMLREKGLGDLESPAGEHVLGLDGIAVIVHPNNALERLDLAALRGIFAGEITSFGDLGGMPGSIHLYARDDRSGTFDTFEHLVLGERALAPSAQRFSDSVELSAAVARDPFGIGFIGIPYIRGARALAIGTPGAALFPSAFTVATEGYQLSRRLYLYVPVQHVQPLALELVNFALSTRGQEFVKAAGFVDLNLRVLDSGPCPRCPPRYAELARVGQRVSLDFRFRTGSAELDNRGLRDLDRLLAFLRESSRSRLVLVGFSDARGAPSQNAKLSLDRAKKVAEALRQRGVHTVEVEAMGSELPVASNDTEYGREKNRRVEVWLR